MLVASCACGLMCACLQVLNVCIKRLVGRRSTLLTPTHPTAPTPNTHTTSLNSQGSSSQSVESGTEQGPSNGDGFYSASDDEDVLYDTHTQTRVQSLIRADHDNTDGGVIMTHVDSGAWASQDADDGGVSGSRAESDGLGSSRVGSGGQAGLGDGVSGLPVEIDGPVSARRAGRVSKRGTVPVPQGVICEVGEGVTLARHPDRPMRTPVTQVRANPTQTNTTQLSSHLLPVAQNTFKLCFISYKATSPAAILALPSNPEGVFQHRGSYALGPHR